MDRLSISNGKALCTDANYFNSECEVTCDEGYELMYEGQEVSRCTERGVWNVTKIVCKPKKCKTAVSHNLVKPNKSYLR